LSVSEFSEIRYNESHTLFEHAKKLSARTVHICFSYCRTVRYKTLHVLWFKVCNSRGNPFYKGRTVGKGKGKGKIHPLYRYWGSVQAVRPVGGVEV
jgi:hypothetical protein